MKKFLIIAAISAAAACGSYAAEVICNMSSFNWTMVAKDALGNPIHNEEEAWPETSYLNKIKAGFKWEYVDEPGVYTGNAYEYFSGAAIYDLSPASGIDPATITSAKLMGVSLLSHDVDSLASEPTFNYVFNATPSEICDIDDISAEIDITSYVLNDLNAGHGTANLSINAPDVAPGTTGINFAQIAMMIDGETPSYILITYEVPEASQCALLLGACGLAFAAWRRRK